MSGLFDTTRNFSLYAVSSFNSPQIFQLLINVQIPAAWVLAFAPHAFAAAQSKSFDNRSPRTYLKSLEADQTIDKAVRPYPPSPISSLLTPNLPDQRPNHPL